MTRPRSPLRQLLVFVPCVRTLADSIFQSQSSSNACPETAITGSDIEHQARRRTQERHRARRTGAGNPVPRRTPPVAQQGPPYQPPQSAPPARGAQQPLTARERVGLICESLDPGPLGPLGHVQDSSESGPHPRAPAPFACVKHASPRGTRRREKFPLPYFPPREQI